MNIVYFIYNIFSLLERRIETTKCSLSPQMPFIRTKDGSIPIIRKAEVFSNNTVHIKKTGT